MSELSANYSDGMGLANKTKCLSAGDVSSCLTLTAITHVIYEPHVTGGRCRSCQSPAEAAADAELHRSPDETVLVSAESLDEENRLKEDDRTAEEPTSPLPSPPSQATVPVDPCEGQTHAAGPSAPDEHFHSSAQLNQTGALISMFRGEAGAG